MTATAVAVHVQRVLDAFDNVRPSGDGWTARCPAHQDRKNSLSLGVAHDGRILIHCHASCDPGMVLYHKGLQFKDLVPPGDVAIPSNGAGRHHPAMSRSTAPSVGESAAPKARLLNTTRYEIRDASGNVAAIHVRRDFDDGTKSMHWERPDGDMGLNGVRVETLPLFGVHRLGSSPTVIVCEGEKAAQALRDLGAPAVGTVTGASGCPSDDSLRALLGRNIIVWPDRDDAGEQHMDRVAERLGKLGVKPNKLFRLDWSDAPAKGDAADFVERGVTRDDLNALVRSSSHPWQPRPTASTSSTPTASSASSTPTSAVLSLGREPAQATRLVQLARQGDAEFFHDAAGGAFITFSSDGHRETWPLSSRAVREWLSHRFFANEETAPGGQALQDALATLAGFARFDGPCREVFVRLAGHEGDIFLDLGDDAWRVVRVTADGWSVIPGSAAPVRFRRPRAMLPLPTPEPGGSLSTLRALLNVANDDAFILIVGWLLGALNPRGSYPILVLHGEQGSAKTTAGRMLRGLIDPNVSPLRTQPRDEGDLLIAASGGLMVAYDNLSSVPDWLSDGLCRLTSGGGLSKRQLFTDVDEVVLDARRPALLTGIESTLSRADALDRAVLVELEQIPKGRRRTEDAVWDDFNAARPLVLGALLTAASTALCNLPTLHLTDLPRLADFARWVEAGAPAFGWNPGDFLQIYDVNRSAADELALDASPIGPLLQAFVDERGEWEGTASDLLTTLNERASETAKKERGWPKQAASLSGQLKRIAPNLRRLGIACEIGVRETTGEKRRVTRLRKNDAKARHQRHRRHYSHDHVDSNDTERVTSASPSVTNASPSGDADPHDDADSFDFGDASDTSDAGDAVSHNSSQHCLFAQMDPSDPDRWTR